MGVKLLGIECELSAFFRGKKVFVTGHTGFKGAWLCCVLMRLGADVCGYSLKPIHEPSLFNLCEIGDDMLSNFGDVLDFERLSRVFSEFEPEIVIHMAAQPLVLESFKEPRKTFETNILGTVNVLECVKNSSKTKLVLNVTTDKVYDQYENEKNNFAPFTENQKLNGSDPYSNSKSCSELVTNSYFRSFLRVKNVAVLTARAGNVIGGGDYGVDRIIPDCVRFANGKEAIVVRNKRSVRPYQFVLDVLYSYLFIIKFYHEKGACFESFNVSPDEYFETGRLVEIFCEKWGEGASFVESFEDCEHGKEAEILKLNNSKFKSVVGFNQRISVEKAVEMVVDFERQIFLGISPKKIVNDQISSYLKI